MSYIIFSPIIATLGHGKTAVDGLGGRIKTLAKHFCLKGGSIRNAKDLHDFIVKDFPHVFATYIPEQEIIDLSVEMADRFARAKQIIGTLGYHCFTPVEGNSRVIECRAYSMQDADPDIKNVTE